MFGNRHGEGDGKTIPRTVQLKVENEFSPVAGHSGRLANSVGNPLMDIFGLYRAKYNEVRYISIGNL
jgi:hypothetical protein